MNLNFTRAISEQETAIQFKKTTKQLSTRQMMFGCKKIIFKTLGTKNYLIVLQFLFRLFYRLGLLKRTDEYKFHHYIKKMIKPGDVVVDIGANLGYFSIIFSKLIRPNGKLISIEPVPVFYNLLAKSLKGKRNCTVYNYALGLENKNITMSIPNEGGFFRTGLAQVAENASAQNYNFESTMIKGSQLLSNLTKIDYIKCDIEGYEKYVLPELFELLLKFKPIVQVETISTIANPVFKFMEDLNYARFNLINGQLIKNYALGEDMGDYLFVPVEKEIDFIKGLDA